MNKTFSAKISGLVQGVGYRYFALREARRMGLRGYVRNLPDGSVEVLAQGQDHQLESFINLLRRGPSGAKVSHVELTWLDDSHRDLSDFTIEF